MRGAIKLKGNRHDKAKILRTQGREIRALPAKHTIWSLDAGGM